jgi:two-component system osmolarity sensor histidine kinase EnvZ
MGIVLWIKRALPKGLLGRSALIMIAPVLLVQLITTYVFYDRHWKKMTELLGENIAGAMNATHELLQSNPENPQLVVFLKEFSVRHFNLRLGLYPPTFTLPKQDMDKLSWREAHLYHHLEKNSQSPFFLSITPETITVYIHDQGQVIELSTETKRLFTRTTPLLIWWAVGSPIFFLLIAFFFMRNQVRPLKELAYHMDVFGKGRPTDPIKPTGALEVRQAAQAFNSMRKRILAYIQQRTEMLAGVSHDLRTPLTRMALEVALLPESSNREDLQEDIRHMRHMIDGYLAFVQGAEEEPLQPLDLKELMEKLVKRPPFNQVHCSLPAHPCMYMGQTQNTIRALMNLLDNALKYARTCHMALQDLGSSWEIIIEDDGPGIPLRQRGEVFKPFFRLEGSRNSETGGIGLGLAIAQDGISHQGGTITLDDSPSLGGLRVIVTFPKSSL